LTANSCGQGNAPTWVQPRDLQASSVRERELDDLLQWFQLTPMERIRLERFSYRFAEQVLNSKLEMMK
jgi:hypothetical protein